jgi:mono/diheme cytochrome c family protein
MKKLLWPIAGIGFLTILFLASLQMPSVTRYIIGPGATAAPVTAIIIPDGPQLYANICSSCHGATPPVAWRTNRTAAQLTESINHGGSMPAYSGILTSAQISAIVQYIQGVPAPVLTAPAIPDGPRLYAVLCSSCHSVTPPVAWRTNRTAAQLTDSINNGVTMPSFNGILTSAQVSAIVQYVQSIPVPAQAAAPNGSQLYATVCSFCHGPQPPAVWRTGRTAAQLTGSIMNGGSVTGGSMPGYSDVLTPAQVSAIVQFVQSGTVTPNIATPPATQTPAATPSTASGAQLYASNCAGCHATPPPALWQSGRTASQLAGAINNGLPGMPAYSGLITPAQVSAIVQYIQGGVVQPATPTPIPVVTPTATPVIAGGAQLYATNCSGCHPVPPPGLWRTGRTLSQLANAINNGVSGMPAYSGVLTPSQVTSIVQYIQNAAPPAPTITPTPTPLNVNGSQLYSSYCSGCHGSPSSSWRTSSTASQLTGAINNGVSGMPGYSGTLTSLQVSAIVQYIQGVDATSTASQSSNPTPPAATSSSTGASLYAANCSRCHGSPSSSWRNDSVSELTGVIRNGEDDMPGFSGRLSSDQISAIVQYIRGSATGTTPTPDRRDDDDD